MVEKGSAFLLKVGDGQPSPTFSTVAGMRTTQLSVVGEAVVVTNKDSGGWRQLLSGAGVRSVAVSAAGVFTGSAAEARVLHDAMTLVSIDAAALDAGGNLAVVGGELLQFGAAAQVAPTRWRLTRLLRARRGLTATHAAGERFTLLAPECVTAVTLPASAIGKTLRVLANGVGDPGAPAEASAAVSGVSVAPPSPVRLAATRLPDGSARLTWVRRSRLGWGWRDGGNAPLGEEREAYRVTIEGGGAARTMVVTTPEALASAAEVAAGGEVAVRQVGTVAQSTETRISLG